MKTCHAVLLMLVGLLVCAPVWASRELSKADAYKHADTVLVGYVYSVRIPALKHIGNLDAMQVEVGLVFNSPRVIRLVVLRQAKGRPSAHVRRIRVTRGHGLLIKAGDRVVAFRFSDGTWRIDEAPRLNRSVHLSPISMESEAH